MLLCKTNHVCARALPERGDEMGRSVTMQREETGEVGANVRLLHVTDEVLTARGVAGLRRVATSLVTSQELQLATSD